MIPPWSGPYSSIYRLDWCSSPSPLLCCGLHKTLSWWKTPRRFSVFHGSMCSGDLFILTSSTFPVCHALLTPAPLASTRSLFVPSSVRPQGLCTSCSFAWCILHGSPHGLLLHSGFDLKDPPPIFSKLALTHIYHSLSLILLGFPSQNF